MGTYVVCHHCKRNIHLTNDKNTLPLTFNLICNQCGRQDSYYSTESFEEKWTYSCVSCNKKFYRTLPPPANVTCPYCNAKLSIYYNDQIILHVKGRNTPNATNNSTVTVGLLGALLGAAVGGPAGAALGGLLGAALGSSSMAKATEGW